MKPIPIPVSYTPLDVSKRQVSNKAVQSDGTTSYVKVKDADGTISMVDVETGF